jgi:GTP cyclohydrolase FolE2
VQANLAGMLAKLSGSGRSQNFESIHNHSAYAYIERDKAKR